jgi:hypothetical protein
MFDVDICTLRIDNEVKILIPYMQFMGINKDESRQAPLIV